MITLGEKIVLRYEVTSTDPNATVVVQRGAGPSTQQQQPRPVAPPVAASTPVMVPPPARVQAPVSAPPPAQAYAPIPSAPVYQQPSAQVPLQNFAPKKKSKALLIVLILVGVLVLFCVVPWIIIDATNSYCSLFPGIMNMLITNACPV